MGEFWDKALAHGTGGRIPAHGNGRMVLDGAFSSTNLLNLKVWILKHVQSQAASPPAAIAGETACLACDQNQFAEISSFLSLLKDHPWIATVAVHPGGANPVPMTGQLSSLLAPNTRFRKEKLLATTNKTTSFKRRKLNNVGSNLIKRVQLVF